MSNSNTNLQTQSSNALHNAIMEAGSKDRSTMSARESQCDTTERTSRTAIPLALVAPNNQFTDPPKPSTTQNTQIPPPDCKVYKETEEKHCYISAPSYDQNCYGTPVVQKSGIQCYNCKEYGHVSRECQKPKRVKDAAYHKEKMLLCKQEEAGVQLKLMQNKLKIVLQAELDKYKDVNYASKVEIDCAKAKRGFNELCAHQEETISIMSQAKEAQIKLYKTREDKELDKVIALENKVKFLKKAQRANPRLYDIGCYNDNLALMLTPDSDETIHSLAKKDFSKSKPVTTQNVSNDFSKPVTAQILPQNKLPIVKNTNVIAPGMYKVHTKPNHTETSVASDIRKPNKSVSFSTGVIPNTSVSRPQLKSNHLEDRVMSNNSQGRSKSVETTVLPVSNLHYLLISFAARRDCSIHRRTLGAQAHDRNLSSNYFVENFWATVK
ncbi:retrovirus-related pol polyprotein from transposon TNT 1-94 [Tanacetum coccineum]